MIPGIPFACVHSDRIEMMLRGVTTHGCAVHVTCGEYHYGHLSVGSWSGFHPGPVRDEVAILSGCICMTGEKEKKYYSTVDIKMIKQRKKIADNSRRKAEN